MTTQPSDAALKMADDILYDDDEFGISTLEQIRLARYIDANPDKFPAPVDPLLEIVREGMAKVLEELGYPSKTVSAYRDGSYDNEWPVKAALAVARRVQEMGR